MWYAPRSHLGALGFKHGQLLDEETIVPTAEKSHIWWCLQPFLDEPSWSLTAAGRFYLSEVIQMAAGTDHAYQLAIKHQVRVAFGTDTLFSAKLAARRGCPAGSS